MQGIRIGIQIQQWNQGWMLRMKASSTPIGWVVALHQSVQLQLTVVELSATHKHATMAHVLLQPIHAMTLDKLVQGMPALILSAQLLLTALMMGCFAMVERYVKTILARMQATLALDPRRVTKLQMPVNPLFRHATRCRMVMDAAEILTAAATNAEGAVAEKLADLEGISANV